MPISYDPPGGYEYMWFGKQAANNSLPLSTIPVLLAIALALKWTKPKQFLLLLRVLRVRGESDSILIICACSPNYIWYCSVCEGASALFFEIRKSGKHKTTGRNLRSEVEARLRSVSDKSRINADGSR